MIQPTLSCNCDDTAFKSITRLLEPLNLSIKRLLIDAIDQCKNESVEKSMTGSPLTDENDDALIEDGSVACSKEHGIMRASARANDEEINFLNDITSPNEKARELHLMT